MKGRLAAMTLALVLGASAASGCSASPDPAEPTPAFTTEEEAFAAAEETYRAYVDALNEVDLSNPETFEDVFAWTTGDANSGARESFSQMHADGWSVAGETVAALAQPRATSPTTEDFSVVGVDVCLDVSDVTLVDENGKSVVSADRTDMQSMLVTLTATPTDPRRYFISEIEGREGSPECTG